MAKQLMLIRHAKSDWGNAGLTDFKRPLNKRGHANAPEMAERMVKQRIIPSLIVASPAVRALSTAQYFAHTWRIKADDIVQEKLIYEANVKALLKIINSFDDQFEQIALFGHNPGITDLANYLSNGHIYNMPTCSIVIIEFPFEHWNEVSGDTGRIVLFDYPKSDED